MKTTFFLMLLLSSMLFPASDFEGSEGMRKDLLTMVNKARSKACNCGKNRFKAAKPLSWDDKLGAAADRHAKDMASKSVLNHTGSDKSTLGQRITDAGYKWGWLGENIAHNQQNAQAVMESWMKSEGHCSNIMSPQATVFGAAVRLNKKGEPYWCQTFAKPLGAK